MSLSALYDLPAPAKLNLFLHVVGRRPDGYHLLQSVFTLIDWCDTLHIERRADGRISREDLGPALPADDLCTRAARLLQAASGTPHGAHIAIDKQVPWGAGLGGGSSDAATTLIALNRLWGLHWPRTRLLELGLQLGADVPFFIGGHNAWVEGIGEQLTPIDLPPASYVVLKPPVAVPTAAIFSSPLLTRDTPRTTMAVFLAQAKSFGKNDLQAGAEAYSTQIVDGLEILKQNFGLGRMSGSGSAVFAACEDIQQERSSAPLEARIRSLATPDSGWVARHCKGLARHPLLAWCAD
ncbi:4-(cytidine 5'-diphospho)-2-C-methyl-D-erythritol kinase [Sphaerotilus sp.]|jgi:4-diphosphocytidyl-2-C-methyl-D-erythritol kinase|uniref:4-(cytidine 5'-diphospho)-2-C-methyl-D-erythritol kinase n=1 Tax=Sphaerotilus sp. TaxID=2093942 RepID=UPI0025CD9E7B|nr:4-(cytidine 5'-diphospho)-2-C-methyl-D-erythritol kinase [Sphaerotilus sp.]